MDKVIIPGFNSFIGKYYQKEIKREIYELIYANEGLYIFKVDYHTSKVTEINDMEEPPIQEEGNINILNLYNLFTLDKTDVFENKDDAYIVANYETKITNEKEFFKRLISGLQQSNKKFVLENKNVVKENTCNIIRYVAFNGNVNVNFINKIFIF